MSKIPEDICKATEERVTYEHAMKLISLSKLTYEEIADTLNLPLDKVRELAFKIKD